MSILTGFCDIEIDLLGAVDGTFDLPVLTNSVIDSKLHLSSNVRVSTALLVFRVELGGLLHLHKFSH